MAKTDWAALVTEPAAEYIARTELERFGLHPYLPQLRKRHHTRPGQYVMRQFPLFPRYLLIPATEARRSSVRIARGINRTAPALAGKDGKLWLAPSNVIEAIREAEQAGEYDEILYRGKDVTLASGVLSGIRARMTEVSETTIELLLPLFGGCRARVSPDAVAS